MEFAPASGGFVSTGGVWCGWSMVQHDMGGNPLFVHRNLAKLTVRWIDETHLLICLDSALMDDGLTDRVLDFSGVSAW